MSNAVGWEEKYQSGDTPWDKGAPSPGLEAYLEAQHLRGPGRVLVPGCGSGHDVRSWARRGFQVTGVDLAPSAVRWAQERTAAANVSAEFLALDFLHAPAPALPFDWMFEHTLYCAIQPADRDLYVEAAFRWLKPGGRLLAVHYMIEDRDGPPFGCTQAELIQRFSRRFEFKAGWIPASYENRIGLELMLLWERRPEA